VPSLRSTAFGAGATASARDGSNDRKVRARSGSRQDSLSPSERIEVEVGWQDDNLATRVCFVAEDANGVCYWVFKERLSARDERGPR
jgi:hypothetical protein